MNGTDRLQAFANILQCSQTFLIEQNSNGDLSHLIAVRKVVGTDPKKILDGQEQFVGFGKENYFKTVRGALFRAFYQANTDVSRLEQSRVSLHGTGENLAEIRRIMETLERVEAGGQTKDAVQEVYSASLPMHER